MPRWSRSPPSSASPSATASSTRRSLRPQPSRSPGTDATLSFPFLSPAGRSCKGPGTEGGPGGGEGTPPGPPEECGGASATLGGPCCDIRSVPQRIRERKLKFVQRGRGFLPSPSLIELKDPNWQVGESVHTIHPLVTNLDRGDRKSTRLNS